MNTVSRKSITVALLAAALAALLTIPIASHAQPQNTATGDGALIFDTTGDSNTADGYNALTYNQSGSYNTAIGDQAMNNNNSGSYNTAIGCYSLYVNSGGCYNTANGFNALFVAGGNYNTGNGAYALYKNSTGQYNTANGANALYHNTAGQYNVANGYGALFGNTTGPDNTANGTLALYSNTSGGRNVATGVSALYSNETGAQNTANGQGALYSNTSGSNNVANGYLALTANTTGNYNVADGFDALSFNSSGSGNIALGYGAGQLISTGSNNIDIGNEGAENDSGVIRIGTEGTHKGTFITGINGVTAGGGVEVYITPNGQLGTIKSSRRFKYDIQNLGASTDRLMDLRPVAFRYKEAAADGTHPMQYGLIAEEVAKVYPDLVQYDKQGKPFTVYYHLLTPMMLNDLQKAHREIESLKAGQQNQSAALQSQVTSLQHANQLQFLISIAVLLLLVGYGFAARKQRSPSRKARSLEPCSSLAKSSI